MHTHLSVYLSVKVMKREICKRGHKFTEENTYVAPGGLRQCRKCKANRHKKLYENPEERKKMLIRSAEWEKNNPERCRVNERENRYNKIGWTISHFEEVFAAQGFKCAICKKDLQYTVLLDDYREAHADHCHDPLGLGPRGILCGHCNKGLGLFKDNPEILRTAAAYLEGYKMAGTSLSNSKVNVGDQITIIGQVTAVSGSGPTAQVTIQTYTGDTIVVQGKDCYTPNTDTGAAVSKTGHKFGAGAQVSIPADVTGVAGTGKAATVTSAAHSSGTVVSHAAGTVQAPKKD